MRAHTRLFVDDNGVLCKRPPDRGIMIASREGDEIPQEFVQKYGLSVQADKVVQKMGEEPDNKAVKGAPNKGSGLTINKAKKDK